MASEVISHAIFCLFPSHPTPHRIVFHSASHSTLAPRPALRSTSHPASRPSLHSTSHPALRPASRLSSPSHPALHSSPYSAQPCSHPASHHALHPAPRPPFPSLSLSQVSSSSHRQAPPSTSLHLPPVHPSPIRVSPPSVFLSQAPSPRTSPRIPSCPSPCAPTPFHTTHFHRTSLLPRIPLAKSLPPRHSIFLPPTHFPSASLHPPCSSAKSRLWIFSCVKRPGSLTT